MRGIAIIVLAGMLELAGGCVNPCPKALSDLPPDLVRLVPSDTIRDYVPFFPRVRGDTLFYLLGWREYCFDCSCGREVWLRDLRTGTARKLWDFDTLCVKAFDAGAFSQENLVVVSIQGSEYQPAPFLLLVHPGSGRVDTLAWGCDLPMVDPRLGPDGQSIFVALVRYGWADTTRCEPGVWRYDRVRDSAWKVLDLTESYGYAYRGYVLDGDSVWEAPVGYFPSLDPWEGRRVVADQAGWDDCAMDHRLWVLDRVESTRVEVEIPWAVPRHPDWAEVPGHGRGIVFGVSWGCPMPDKRTTSGLSWIVGGCSPRWRHLSGGLWFLKNWERYIVR